MLICRQVRQEWREEKRVGPLLALFPVKGLACLVVHEATKCRLVKKISSVGTFHCRLCVNSHCCAYLSWLHTRPRQQLPVTCSIGSSFSVPSPNRPPRLRLKAHCCLLALLTQSPFYGTPRYSGFNKILRLRPSTGLRSQHWEITQQPPEIPMIHIGSSKIS